MFNRRQAQLFVWIVRQICLTIHIFGRAFLVCTMNFFCLNSIVHMGLSPRPRHSMFYKWSDTFGAVWWTRSAYLSSVTFVFSCSSYMDRTSQRERAWNNKNKMANIQISSSHKKGKATVYFSQEVGGRNRPKILRWLLQKTKTVHFLQYSHNLPGNTIWNIFTVLGNTVPSMPHDPNIVSTLDHIHFNHSDPSCHSYKLPGILSDEHLWASFSLHIDSLKSKLSKSLYGFNRVKKLVPQKTPKTYVSLFHSHMLYCPLTVSCA